jgi:hypothetical protein
MVKIEYEKIIQNLTKFDKFLKRFSFEEYLGLHFWHFFFFSITKLFEGFLYGLHKMTSKVPLPWNHINEPLLGLFL